MKTFDIVAHGRHSKLSLPLFYVLLKSFLSQLNSLYPGDKVTAGARSLEADLFALFVMTTLQISMDVQCIHEPQTCPPHPKTFYKC